MTTGVHTLPNITISRPIAIRKRHAAVALGVIALTVWMIRSREAERVPVLMVNPVYADVESTVSATGTVIPVDDFPARANFGGVVEKVFVKLGQKVQAGQILLQLKDQYAYARVANARAALDDAEVSNENVQTNGSQEDRIVMTSELMKARMEQNAAARSLATLKQLEANGSVSESEVAAGTQRLQTANDALNTLMERSTDRYSKTDIESWRDKVEADKASVAAEKVSYANAHIGSPIGGTVYALTVTPYDFVPVGTDMLHVADLSKLRIHADFYEMDVRNLRPGEPVVITWEGNRSRTWKGRVVETPFAVTDQGLNRMGRATIEIDDEKGDLPVNATVTVAVTTDRHANVLSIPREALRADGANYYVFRVTDGRLEKTPVQVGIVNTMQAEITKGLSSSDEVALHATNNERLVDHLRMTRAK